MKGSSWCCQLASCKLTRLLGRWAWTWPEFRRLPQPRCTPVHRSLEPLRAFFLYQQGNLCEGCGIKIHALIWDVFSKYLSLFLPWLDRKYVCFYWHKRYTKSEITSSSSLMLNGASRTMELCLIINKSIDKSHKRKHQWHLHCLTGFFALHSAICLPEGCSSTRFGRCQDSRLCVFALRVSMQTSVPTARWFTRDTIHLMFAYPLLPGKPCMFMVIMRSCLKIDHLPSFSCPSVCSTICRVLPARMFVPVAVQAVHPVPPPLHVSFLQCSSSLVFSSLVEVAKLALLRLTGSFREVGKSPCWFLNFTRKLASA